MGPRYFLFRVKYEILKRTGILKRRFPTDYKKQGSLSLTDWKNQKISFFFDSKQSLGFGKNPTDKLKKKIENYKGGRFEFFGGQIFDLGMDYDWMTNPSNSFKYDPTKHWTEIADYSKDSGDIKFVWEKSRFSFLYDLIRYDYHFGEDLAHEVFNEIEDWIDKNTINQGPNFRCSQEISLRVFNWIFALNYFKNHEVLNEKIFDKISSSMRAQMQHVFDNIHFSRIAVRNNHAITETLMLYLFGLLFPTYPESKKYRTKGKSWFEKEILYQVYEDGTYVQYSHNYHRVVIQLMTIAFSLAKVNGEKFSAGVYERAKRSLEFLLSQCNDKNGQLPNYGANDGALFFPFNNCDQRDFRGQLNALYFYFSGKNIFSSEDHKEDANWIFGSHEMNANEYEISLPLSGIKSFNYGGFYSFRDGDDFTFVRCGNHPNRPSQADNLHIDIWHKGENMLHDCGSFKYNASDEELNYFMGTSSHNTIMLGDQNQMEKGARFIWYHWTSAEHARSQIKNSTWEFSGKIKAFGHLGKSISHERKITKEKGEAQWIVEDTINHNTNLPAVQLWHTLDKYINKLSFHAIDEKGEELQKEIMDGWYSHTYGVKTPSKIIRFQSSGKTIKTKIRIA